ncbi:YceI family protein [Salinisphaera sp.]|uniref:YceI family protein n=1 Tax=Salinisphaera sp. TaxID=1914330 RepID=UPI002D7798BE|nr:YceI family protein [Salinisphaera sp.]HET7313826.1 YceI family protein [Salinisphaera sp.]
MYFRLLEYRLGAVAIREVDDIACRRNPLEKSHYTCGFSAETEIKRSDFGMNAYPKLVGDRVELSIEAEANKPVTNS